MAAAASYAFERTRLVRFAHCDAAGIVFFPQYLVLINDLVEDWLGEGLGVPNAELILRRRIGTPTSASAWLASMSEPSMASGTTSAAPAACSLSRCRSSCVRTTTGTCGAWARVLASTLSADGTSR